MPWYKGGVQWFGVRGVGALYGVKILYSHQLFLPRPPVQRGIQRGDLFLRVEIREGGASDLAGTKRGRVSPLSLKEGESFVLVEIQRR